MKKLTLKANAFNKGEVLTRAQLKKVMGGQASGGGTYGDTKGDCMAKYWNFESTGNEDGDAIMLQIILKECDKLPTTRPV